MKKFIKISALVLAMNFSFMAANLDADINVSYANEAASKIDLAINMPNTPYREDLVNLDQNDKMREDVLAELRNIRAKAWDENIKVMDDHGNKVISIREKYEKGVGSRASRENFIDEFAYSSELEKLALQMAYELTINDFGKYRPGGFRFETIATEHESMGYYLWNREEASSMTVASTFNTWLYDYDGVNNYENLKKSDGKDDSIVYPMLMIVPTQLSVGYAKVTNPQTGVTASVLTFGFDAYSRDALKNYKGTYKMTYGDKNYKALDKKTEKTLKQAIKDSEMQIKVANNLLENFPKTVEKVRGDLYKLLYDAEDLLLEAYKYIPVE